ncbi:MAG TPA: hypothetical protein VFA07_18605 [Chthonomonadaceae bacterium]|nr:hypothetical protein [Chthonomonadaceae bacterium]
MLRTPRTYVAITLGLGAAALAAVASYSHLTARMHPNPNPVATASTTAPETFQAYTILHGLPPRPAKRTNRHGKLRLTKIHGKYYLAGADNHYYLAGRDRQGHLVPIYHEPQTDKDYPLYYDGDRDRYYRITEDSQTHQFYRNYEGDPEDRLYEEGHDQRDGQEYAQDNGDRGDYQESDDYPPAPEDQPDIVVADSARSSDEWLLAIPVIAAAFLLLPRHHHTPHFTPPTNMVIAGNPARSHGTLPGPRPHIANPPIFVRPPVVPPVNGKPSLPNPGVLTHRWMPPGSAPVVPPPAVVAMHRTAPPAKPPLFQRLAHQEVSMPGEILTTGHHPVPAIHAAPSAHNVPSITHHAAPVSGRSISITSRPAVHVPAPETTKQTTAWPFHATRPAGKVADGHVSTAQERRYTQAKTLSTHTTAASPARPESASATVAARTTDSSPRPGGTGHAPAVLSPAGRETSAARPPSYRPQPPQEASPARQSNTPSSPARQETRPSNPPRPAANEPYRPPSPASPPPATHSAPAEQPHYTPPEPPRPAPSEPPRPTPAEPAHHAAPAPEPSHNNENHGNDNNSGGNNGGKGKKG